MSCQFRGLMRKCKPLNGLLAFVQSDDNMHLNPFCSMMTKACRLICLGAIKSSVCNKLGIILLRFGSMLMRMWKLSDSSSEREEVCKCVFHIERVCFPGCVLHFVLCIVY